MGGPTVLNRLSPTQNTGSRPSAGLGDDPHAEKGTTNTDRNESFRPFNEVMVAGIADHAILITCTEYLPPLHAACPELPCVVSIARHPPPIA